MINNTLGFNQQNEDRGKLHGENGLVSSKTSKNQKMARKKRKRGARDETPTLGPPDEKSQLFGKGPDAGKD